MSKKSSQNKIEKTAINDKTLLGLRQIRDFFVRGDSSAAVVFTEKGEEVKSSVDDIFDLKKN